MESVTHPGINGPYSFARRVFHSLPYPLRNKVSPIVYFFYKILGTIRPEIWNITGIRKGSQSPISVCLYNTTPQSRDYLCKLIFCSSVRAHRLGRTWLWNTHKVPDAAGNSALIFCEVDASYLRFLPAGRGIVIPTWIYGEVELPRGPSARKCNGVQNALRKIRQHSLDYEISRDRRRLDDFYNNMYLPHLKLRYGDSAYIASKETVEAGFDKGELLFVKKNGECITGQLITYKGSCACLAWLGVRDGNWDHARAGAEAASWEYFFRRAEDRGCLKASLTRARPFLNDGLLRFKRTWSQKLVRSMSLKFLLKICADSDAAKAFLVNTPLIFERAGRFYGAVFLNDKMPLTLDALQATCKEHFHPGMAALIVFQFSPRSMAVELESLPASPPDFTKNNLTDSLDFRQLSRAEWMELIQGLGFVRIERAVAIYPRSND